MLVKTAIHPDQIRWWVKSALNGFEDLATEDAIANACHDLRRLLQYLDALDAAHETVLVANVAGIEAPVRSELVVRQGDGAHQPDLKIARFPPV